MGKTNADRACELIIEKAQIKHDADDVMAAFRDRVRAMRMEAKPDEKSVFELMEGFKKRLKEIEYEELRLAHQPGQMWLEL